jgi:hypothetical protein
MTVGARRISANSRWSVVGAGRAAALAIIPVHLLKSSRKRRLRSSVPVNSGDNTVGCSLLIRKNSDAGHVLIR